MIRWNKNLRLILSDVDETIAGVYVPAEPEMCQFLSKLLEKGIILFLITGQSIESIQWRITEHINPTLRKNILAGTCSGAEVWGFDADGNLLKEAYYSLYDETLNRKQRKKWREIIDQLVKEFRLEAYPSMPKPEFIAKSNKNPLSIMLEDRGAQITFEVVNATDLTPEQGRELEINVPNTHGSLDLRIPIIERAEQLFEGHNLPITPRLAGTFAVDFAMKGAYKTTAIHRALSDARIISSLDINYTTLQPDTIEVWGDKFSTIHGGTDRHISEALPKEVRSIDFREEDPQEFLDGYNIVLWDGKEHLHHGLLEFLRSNLS